VSNFKNDVEVGLINQDSERLAVGAGARQQARYSQGNRETVEKPQTTVKARSVAFAFLYS